MKQKIIDNLRFILLLLSVITGILAVSKSFATETVTTFKAEVLYLSDGDTIRVQPLNQPAPLDPNAKGTTLRFIGIDTPEMHVPNAQGVFVGQPPFGEDAKAALEAMIPVGTIVTVEDHGQDSYGRTLARVFEGKKDVNLEMVRQGWAMPYNICTGTASCNASYAKEQRLQEYFDACKYSRSYGLGIYNPKNTLKELPFEFRMRVQGRAQVRFPGSFKNETYYNPEDYKKVDICDLIFFQTESDAKRLQYQHGK